MSAAQTAQVTPPPANQSDPNSGNPCNGPLGSNGEPQISANLPLQMPTNLVTPNASVATAAQGQQMAQQQNLAGPNASRFSEPQIVGILKEHEAGVATKDLCRRKHGISPATFYSWKAKFGGMEVRDLAKMKALEDENRRSFGSSARHCAGHRAPWQPR